MDVPPHGANPTDVAADGLIAVLAEPGIGRQLFEPEKRRKKLLVAIRQRFGRLVREVEPEQQGAELPDGPCHRREVPDDFAAQCRPDRLESERVTRPFDAPSGSIAVKNGAWCIKTGRSLGWFDSRFDHGHPFSAVRPAIIGFGVRRVNTRARRAFPKVPSERLSGPSASQAAWWIAAEVRP